jgi:hypothetical protein
MALNIKPLSDRVLIDPLLQKLNCLRFSSLMPKEKPQKEL